MTCRCCMKSVKSISCNIHSSMKSECNISTINIVINSFWKSDYFQSLICKELGSFMCTVSAESKQTVKLLLFIGFFHIFYFVNVVVTNHLHHFKRLTFCTENCAASGKNSGKISRIHVFAKIIDKSVITI